MGKCCCADAPIEGYFKYRQRYASFNWSNLKFTLTKVKQMFRENSYSLNSC